MTTVNDLQTVTAPSDASSATPSDTGEPTTAAPRDRLLGAAVKVFARLGYERATIADVVREARVSRRTFYEHFDDKRDCLFASYDGGARLLVGTVIEAVSHHDRWQDRLPAGVDRFVEVMMLDVDITRVMLQEVMSAGHEAVARRRRAHRQWAEMWVGELDKARADDATLRDLTVEMSLAHAQVLVAAVLELIMLAIEDDAEPDREQISRDVRSLIMSLCARVPHELDPTTDAGHLSR